MTAENRAAIRNLPGVLNAFRPVSTWIYLHHRTNSSDRHGCRRGDWPATRSGLRAHRPYALAAFLTMRAFEFVRTDVGIGQLPVKLVGGVPGFLSDGNGPTHQALEDISLMRGIPRDANSLP